MPSPTGALGAQPLTPRAPLAGVRRFAFSMVRSPHVLALVDQAVVSATSFLTIVVLARYANATELGAYSFVLSLAAAILLVQESLILTPYSIYSRRDDAAGRAQDSANLALAAGLTLMTVAAALAYLVGARAFGAGEQGTEVARSLAILAPGALLREFVKRMDLVHLRMRRVLAFDVAYAGLAGAMLAATVYFERVTSTSVSACLGAAGGFLFCVWLFLKSDGERLDFERLRATLVENLRVGGWYLISQTAALVREWITFWLLFAFEGAAATGVFAACTSIVAFGNPILYGLSNILPGRSAQAWTAGGGAALKKQVAVDAALLGAALGVLCLALALAGGRLLEVFFSAPEYQANSSIMLLLALSSLATGLGLPVSRGLAIMEKPRAVVMSSVAGTIMTVAAVLGLMLVWGVFGAALGLFIGNALGTAFRWLAFVTLAPADPELAPTLALARSALGADPDLQRLGEGDYAVIYAAAPRGVAI
jgi:O-antigen/teichoic acid export membrane protein